MAGLYVKLDVDYASDDKILSAGVMPELLYVRALAFSKRTMSDGKILKAQLALVGLGIPAVAKHADALVKAGLWRAFDGGWTIAAWPKHNKGSGEIKEQAEQKRLASVKANHDRWHVEGKRSAKCPFCDPIRTPDRIGVGVRPESTESETESKPESESGTSESEPEEPIDHAAAGKPLPGRISEPRSFVEIVEPSGPIAIRRETSAVLDEANRLAPESPVTASDRKALRSTIEEAITAGYTPTDLANAVASSPFRTPAGVMGELRKRKQQPQRRPSVGDAGLSAAAEWLEGREGA